MVCGCCGTGKSHGRRCPTKLYYRGEWMSGEDKDAESLGLKVVLRFDLGLQGIKYFEYRGQGSM